MYYNIAVSAAADMFDVNVADGDDGDGGDDDNVAWDSNADGCFVASAAAVQSMW